MPFRLERDGSKVISLTDNVPLITAWSNDKDYLNSFSEQLKALGSKGDILIAISSSGNSSCSKPPSYLILLKQT